MPTLGKRFAVMEATVKLLSKQVKEIRQGLLTKKEEKKASKQLELFHE